MTKRNTGTTVVPIASMMRSIVIVPNGENLVLSVAGILGTASIENRIMAKIGTGPYGLEMNSVAVICKTPDYG